MVEEHRQLVTPTLAKFNAGELFLITILTVAFILACMIGILYKFRHFWDHEEDADATEQTRPRKSCTTIFVNIKPFHMVSTLSTLILSI